MGWTQDEIKRHETTIADMQEGISMMRAGKLRISEQSSIGEATDLRPELIANYEKAIEALQKVVSGLKGAE